MTNPRPFIIALAFGLIAVILVYFYIRQIQQEAGTTEVEMAKVVRATANIPPRTTVRVHMVEEIEMPAGLVTADMITESDELLGQVSVTSIYEKQIVIQQMFREEIELEDLSRMLEEGERAVTVGVTEVSGLGGNIRVGDHVDILVTILSNDEVGVASTFTILRDIQVMAVGQDIGFREEEDQATGISKSVTVRVSPQEAEILALASEIGSLRLTLRDPDDEFAPALDGTALTEFVRYTPTREDLEQAAARARAEAGAQVRAQPPVERQPWRPSEFVDREEIVELEPPKGPPYLVELILGGESQIIQLYPME